MFDSAWSVVQSNPYFHAGAGLYTIGIAVMVARIAMRTGSELARRRLLISVEMTNRDPSYAWVMEWIARHHSASYRHKSVVTDHLVVHANDAVSARMRFVPSPGLHFFFHQGSLIWVDRKRQIEKTMGTDVLETVQLTTLGTSWAVMEDILDNAASEASSRDAGMTIIYTTSGPKWIRFHEPRQRKPLGSVVLDCDKAERVLRDIEEFRAAGEWYTRMGIPYRRGYLLHGPPGCGKSSFIMALAGHLNAAICMLSLGTRHLDDEGLNMLLNTAPQRSIVLLEDIDRAFSQDSRVTLSGLLNSIDGVAAQEGRLLFMTTNHPERLDPALVRPGRADVRVEIGLATRQQAERLFLRFFPGEAERAARFAGTVSSGQGISMAALQGHLFAYRHSAEEALGAADMLLDAEQSHNDRLRPTGAAPLQQAAAA